MLRTLGLVACLSAALACASATRVHLDPAHDWNRSASWNWLPLEPGRAELEDSQLRDRLGDAIERELAARGLERSSEPDLLVRCRVAVVPERVLRTETSATQFLPSLHMAPSYEVGASQKRWIHYEHGVLGIDVVDAESGRVVWRALRAKRVRGSFLLRADQEIEALLESFPHAAPAMLTAQR